MICDRIREQIPECLAGRLDPAAREKVIDHLETCSACRAEVAELGSGVERFGNHAGTGAKPGNARAFPGDLAAYQEGYWRRSGEPTYAAPPKSFWAGLLPARPAWQAAFSAVLLIGGILGGRYMLRHAGPRKAIPKWRNCGPGGEPAAAGGALAAAAAVAQRAPARGHLQRPDRAARPAGGAGPAAGGESRYQRQRAALRGGRAGEVRRPTRKCAARWWIPCPCRIRRWCRSR